MLFSLAHIVARVSFLEFLCCEVNCCCHILDVWRSGYSECIAIMSESTDSWISELSGHQGNGFVVKASSFWQVFFFPHSATLSAQLLTSNKALGETYCMWALKCRMMHQMNFSFLNCPVSGILLQLQKRGQDAHDGAPF